MRRYIWLILLVCTVCRATDEGLRFELKNGYLIVVQCSVGELRGLNGIVDTGSSDTVLDNKIVSRLSLPTSRDSAIMVDREVAVRGIAAPVIGVGPIHSAPGAAIAADLSNFSAELGVHIDVIIGMDVLRTTTFQVDYDARVLRFGSFAPMRHRAAIVERTGLATIELRGVGAPLHLLVDTGFSDLLLFRNRLGGALKLRPAAMNLATTEGSAKLQAFEPATIGIGDWQAGRRTLFVKDTGEAPPTPFDGLLGPRFLKAHRVGFDFGHQTIEWE